MNNSWLQGNFGEIACTKDSRFLCDKIMRSLKKNYFMMRWRANCMLMNSFCFVLIVISDYRNMKKR